jgi:putative tryptophan/tyrosine transport system substrate-binding protein
MGGAIAASYLRDATTKIPIVFMFVPDPVGMKLVSTFGRGKHHGIIQFWTRGGRQAPAVFEGARAWPLPCRIPHQFKLAK